MASSTSGEMESCRPACDEIARQRPHQHERDERYAEQDRHGQASRMQHHAAHGATPAVRLRAEAIHFSTQVVRT